MRSFVVMALPLYPRSRAHATWRSPADPGTILR